MNYSAFKRYQDAKKYNEDKKKVDTTIANAIEVLKGYDKASEAEQFVAQVAINALGDLAKVRAKENEKGMDK